MYAADHGHVDCLQLLLERGADVNKRATDGGTAAHYAALRGHKKALLALLDAGCEIERDGPFSARPHSCTLQIMAMLTACLFRRGGAL